MPIDERLRSGLPAAVDAVRPDVDTELGAVLNRARHRSLVRLSTYVVGLVGAAFVVLALALVGDNTPRSVGPVSPVDQVAVLDPEQCLTADEGLIVLGVGGSWASVFPGWTYRTWVLDVDGVPVLIMAAHGPDTTATERAELTAIVEDLTFVDGR